MVPLIRKWAHMEKAYDKQLLRLLARRTYKLTNLQKVFLMLQTIIIKLYYNNNIIYYTISVSFNFYFVSCKFVSL